VTGEASPWSAPELLANPSVRVRFWQSASGTMSHLVRNADGDELLFVHKGEGQLYCDFGHLSFTAGDYIMIPRGTMWRVESTTPLAVLNSLCGTFHCCAAAASMRSRPPVPTSRMFW